MSRLERFLALLRLLFEAFASQQGGAPAGAQASPQAPCDHDLKQLADDVMAKL